MQRYRAVIRSGDAMMVPDDDGYYVIRLDAFAYAEQRVREAKKLGFEAGLERLEWLKQQAVREEREAIVAMLSEWGRQMTGPTLRIVLERIQARGAEVISRQTTSSHEEARIYLPDGLTTAPKPLEKLTCHAEGEAVKITWADVHRINALIDAVEALRKERV